MMDILQDVSNEIEKILKKECPDIPWMRTVMGPIFPKSLQGFIFCDEVNYDPFDKLGCKATAEFTIEIICPNPKDISDEVEEKALTVRNVLQEYDTLHDLAEDSYVKKIIFATPAGMTDVGVAIIQFVVIYDGGL